MGWQHEITELHERFQAYFLGETDSLERVDAVLAESFTIVGPNGAVSDRVETMAALEAGHAHTSNLAITVSDFQLLHEVGDVIVASYIEHHELGDGRSNHRLSTVVFQADPGTPHGVRWLRVHETWIP